jgi:branched-chain amino acid transport system substrate-binding protein
MEEPMESSKRQEAAQNSGAESVQQHGLTRRQFVQTGATVAAAGSIMGKKAFASSRPLKIGYVSPETGALAPFGEADQFVVNDIRRRLQGGIPSGGSTRQVEIIVRDSQSSSNRCAEVTAQLIKSDKVDIVLAAGTADTVNPVADQCEINGVPCVSNDAPWQAYFFGRGGNPAKGFDWTYHFFFGVETIGQVMCDIFSLVPTNKKIGMLFGNDVEGSLFTDPVKGFPPVIKERGFTPLDPGRFMMNTQDFSAQISFFKKNNCEILFGNMATPVFSTFWAQAAQQGYKPKNATIGRALLFPAAVNSIGPRAEGLTIELWWSPFHPFKSGLTGQTAKQYCEMYESVTKKQWTQPLGFRHALFEVAIDVLKRAKNPESAHSVIESVRNTRYNSIAGPIQWQQPVPNQWTAIPVKNVCTTPVVSGQWVKGKKWPFDLVVTDNRRYPLIPVQRKAKPLP